MILTKEYKNFDGGKFYTAKATVINRTVTGMTKKEALRNLKNVIRERIKKV